MKFDFLEFFKALCWSVFWGVIDLVLFDVFLRFFDIETAYLFSGMGLGFIFYHLAVKIGMIKYD